MAVVVRKKKVVSTAILHPTEKIVARFGNCIVTPVMETAASAIAQSLILTVTLRTLTPPLSSIFYITRCYQHICGITTPALAFATIPHTHTYSLRLQPTYF